MTEEDEDELIETTGTMGFCRCPLPWPTHCYGGKKGVYVCILKWLKKNKIINGYGPKEE